MPKEVEIEYVATLYDDDYPGAGNQGLQLPKTGGLQKHGFKHGDKVRVRLTISKVDDKCPA